MEFNTFLEIVRTTAAAYFADTKMGLCRPRVDLVDAATIATDCATGNMFRVTLGGDRTLGEPSNLLAGEQYIWELVQDGSGGRIVTPHSTFHVAGLAPGSPLGLSTPAGSVDVLRGYYNGTNIMCDPVVLSVGSAL